MLFPQIPADLQAETPDALAELEAQLVAFYSESRVADNPDFAQLRSAAEGLKAVRAELSRRSTETLSPEQLAALDAELGLNQGEPSDPPATDPTVTDPAPNTNPTFNGDALSAAATVGAQAAVAALSPVLTSIAERLAGTNPAMLQTGNTARTFASRLNVPPGIETGGRTTGRNGRLPMVITASADLREFSPGQAMDGPMAIAKAMHTRFEGLGKSSGVVGEKVPVAQLRANVPDEQVFHVGDDLGNLNKMLARTQPDAEAVIASGGLCAPVAPYYDLMIVATDLRPVAGALPTFIADRGGIRLVTPPHLIDLVDVTPPDPNPYNLGPAVGVETVAQDAAGGTKLCFDVPCNTITEFDIEIIWRCLQFSNVTARTWPEEVDAYNRLALAAWAQAAEQLMLTQIGSYSTNLTFHKTFGTARQLVGQLAHAAAYLRNNNRTDPNLTIRVLLPAWVIAACIVDVANTLGSDVSDQLAVGQAEIEGWLAKYNLVVSYYIDTATGAGQTFTQAVGGDPVPDFPATVVSYVFFEGSFLHLDAGTLDLGLIRDSVLTTINKFRNFAESFESVAFIGPEALAITHTACPDGTYAAAVAITTGQACPESGSGL